MDRQLIGIIIAVFFFLKNCPAHIFPVHQSHTTESFMLGIKLWWRILSGDGFFSFQIMDRIEDECIKKLKSTYTVSLDKV